jgi:hypothetical protein
VVAPREIRDVRAGRLDHARGFVPERHRQRPRPIAVDHRKVGMAKSRRLDAHQHLARPGTFELQLLDRQWLAGGVGARLAHLVQDGGPDLHRCLPDAVACVRYQ